jgi:hypothetical protein
MTFKSSPPGVRKKRRNVVRTVSLAMALSLSWYLASSTNISTTSVSSSSSSWSATITTMNAVTPIAPSTIASSSSKTEILKATAETHQRNNNDDDEDKDDRKPNAVLLQQQQAAATSTTEPNRFTTTRHSVRSTTTNHNSTSTTTTPIINAFPLSIVAALKGEMGNYLSSIAYAMGLQLWLRDRGYTNTSIVLWPTKNDATKYAAARNNVLHCFPQLRHLFETQLPPTLEQVQESMTTTREFKTRKQQQNKWLDSVLVGGKKERKQLLARVDQINGVLSTTTGQTLNWVRSAQDIDQGLDALESLIQLRGSTPLSTTHGHEILRSPNTNATISTISLPYLFSRSLQFLVMMDKYHDELIPYFEWDHEACCGTQMPYPNESVFHFRNYATELGFFNDKDGETTTDLTFGGCQEVPPDLLAQTVLGHLRGQQPSDDNGTHAANRSSSSTTTTANVVVDRVAMTSRYPESTETQRYVDALQQPHPTNGRGGIPTRVISNQTAVQDFCFLLHAPRELIGIASSTYVKWAAVLGHAPINRLYVYDTLLTERKFPNDMNYKRNTYPLTHPALARRIQFERYQSKDLLLLMKAKHTTTTTLKQGGRRNT